MVSIGCNEVIDKMIQLADELIELSNIGDDQRDDISCGVLFGTARDCGYKIKAMAEAELAKHLQRAAV